MSFFRRILPSDLKSFIRKRILGIEIDTYYYSQCGEDAILNSIFEYIIKKEKGFYIDVGAYHPYKGSNTYLFYKKGWKGINIDPNPFSIELFKKYRPGDINLVMGIAKNQGELNYHIIDEKSTMNSFSEENLKRLGLIGYVKEIKKIPTYPLSFIADKYLPVKEKIDFLNIDAEGFEMEVLESNNWNKIYPLVIAIEQNDVLTFEDVLSSDVCHYLKQKNYQVVSKNIIVKDVATVIYLRQ
jgi:FkbM family methyltransferase